MKSVFLYVANLKKTVIQMMLGYRQIHLFSQSLQIIRSYLDYPLLYILENEAA